MATFLAAMTGLTVLSAATKAEAEAVELVVSLAPDELVLGRNHTARLTVTASGDGDEDIRGIRLGCNVGRITAPRRNGPREWVATYHLPERTFPQVALIIARTEGLPQESFGETVVSLRGQTVIVFRTDPGARVSVVEGSRTFGPVRAGRDGLVRVPVVLGPGANTVTAHSVDAVGNRSEREVPLNLPSYPRIVVSAPDRVRAGGTIRVAALAIEADGTPAAQIDLAPSRGTSEAVSARAPLSVFALTAPELVGDGELVFTATVDSSESAEAMSASASVEVLPDSAAAIVMRTDREAVVPGSDQSVTVRAAVRDQYGNIRPDDGVTMQIAGQPIEASPSPDGGVSATLRAPPTEVGLGVLVIEARFRGLIERARVRLVGGPAVLARIEAPEEIVADGRTAAEIRVLLVGETGLPASEIPNIRVTSGTLRGLEREADGWWRAEFVPRRASLLTPKTATIEAARGPASARASVHLSPPIPWLTIGLSAGLQTNAGALLGPTGRLELATRVGLARGWLEIFILSGLSFARISADVPRGSSEISLFEVPLSVGIGYAINFRSRVSIGVTAMGGALVVIERDRFTFQPDASQVLVAPSIEAAFDVSIRVGRGEFYASAGFGWATAQEGTGLTGNLLGVVVLGGYRLFIL